MFSNQLFNSSSVIKDSSTFINYRLVDMELYASSVKSKKNSGNYQIEYSSSCPSSSNSYEVSSKLFNDEGNFCVVNFYFYYLYHNNIQGITDDDSNSLIGEFIIETVNTSNGDKLFLCFFIQEVNSNGTDDYLVKNNGSMSKIYDNIIINEQGDTNLASNTYISSKAVKINLSIDGTIPPQDKSGCIIYRDMYNDANSQPVNAYVAVYLNPISISNKNMTAFLKGFLNKDVIPPFKNYPTDPTKNILKNSDVLSSTGVMPSNLSSSLNKLSSVIGINSNDESGGPVKLYDDIYIDCNPTGVSEEEINTYNLPINSDLSEDLQNKSFLQICGNFAMFGLLLVVSFAGIPSLYLSLVKDGGHYYVQIVMVAYLCILFIALIADGFKKVNMEEVTAGISMAVLAVLTFVLTSYEILKIGNVDSFDSLEFFSFLFNIGLFVITKAYTLIIAAWIIIIITLSILGMVESYDKLYLIELGLWIGLACVVPLAGLLTYIGEINN